MPAKRKDAKSRKLPASSSARLPRSSSSVSSVVSRSICPTQLLGRKPVNLDTPELQRFLAGKVILVTGAGGSIGSEICRQAMRFCPAKLILLEQAENALFEIDRELRQRWMGAELIPVIADICDARRINQVFQSYRPHVVFHAAAHKHVPMMELNPGEAIKNNVFGTKTVADAARAAGVHSFVMISTDKAVNPTSVMGAAKRVAELYVQSLNSGVGCRVSGFGNTNAASDLRPPTHEPRTPNPETRFTHTRFAAVRFGNVLGSSGSVVPIFQKQLEAGGPITITHPDMKRYFMTIPEASQLVMQAGAIAQSGAIFVLDMGEPVKIIDLAKAMIRKYGMVLGRDIQIKVTGIRPGEKLYEELACDNEETLPTSHPKIRVWQLPPASRMQIKSMLDELSHAMHESKDNVIRALMNCVPEYTPESIPRPASQGLQPLLRLVEPQLDEKVA